MQIYNPEEPTWLVFQVNSHKFWDKHNLSPDSNILAALSKCQHLVLIDATRAVVLISKSGCSGPSSFMRFFSSMDRREKGVFCKDTTEFSLALLSPLVDAMLFVCYSLNANDRLRGLFNSRSRCNLVPVVNTLSYTSFSRSDMPRNDTLLASSDMPVINTPCTQSKNIINYTITNQRRWAVLYASACVQDLDFPLQIR